MNNAWIEINTQEDKILVVFREIAAIITKETELIVILNSGYKLSFPTTDESMVDETLRQIKAGLSLS